MPFGPEHDAPGSLSDAPHVALLRRLYRRGQFLMADERTGRIDAYDADPRAIIPLSAAEGLHFPRSLLQRVRSRRFTITSDEAFREVITACSASRADGTWISPALIDLYTDLHRAPARDHVHAHSIEAWAPGPNGRVLVAGLYGVAVGAVFCGESMFSRPEMGGTDGSKVCLVHLVHHLVRRGFRLLDSQIWNPHLGRFGCRPIPRSTFRKALRDLRDLETPWASFDPELAITSQVP